AFGVMLATTRSGMSVSVSVAVLLAGVVSNNPGGGLTVAVLTKAPVAGGLSWATAVKMAGPAGSRGTGGEMLPMPVAAPTLEPAEATAVQLTELMADGNRSVTVEATAVLGPALLTMML